MVKDLNKPTKLFTCVYEDSSSGGKYMRCVGDKVYHVIEWMDMDDAMGVENEGRSKYNVELDLVDLNTIGEREIESALQSGDMVGEKNPVRIAETVHLYGCKAPLFQDAGNNLSKLMTLARGESRSLSEDSELMDERMRRPVNALGSTAAEYMVGDINSAMVRGVMADNQDAKICAKMYGAREEDIQELVDLGKYIAEQEKLYGDE